MRKKKICQNIQKVNQKKSLKKKEQDELISEEWQISEVAPSNCLKRYNESTGIKIRVCFEFFIINIKSNISKSSSLILKKETSMIHWMKKNNKWKKEKQMHQRRPKNMKKKEIK